jgi:hypothetical protein
MENTMIAPIRWKPRIVFNQSFERTNGPKSLLGKFCITRASPCPLAFPPRWAADGRDDPSKETQTQSKAREAAPRDDS